MHDAIELPIDIDVSWRREDLYTFSSMELELVQDAVDETCIRISNALDIAKAKFKATGEEADPVWMAKTKGKLAHMRKKRQMLQEVRSDIRRKENRIPDDLREIVSLMHSGYGGILPNGNIVDRRKYPNAIALQENFILGVPKPVPVPTGKSLATPPPPPRRDNGNAGRASN